MISPKKLLAMLLSLMASFTTVPSFTPTIAPLNELSTRVVVRSVDQEHRDELATTEETKYPIPSGVVSSERFDQGSDNAFNNWVHPSVINNTSYQKLLDELVRPLEVSASPIYFSTDESGKVFHGLSKIPSPEKIDGPLLVVGNHQLFVLDMWMMVPHLYEERKIALRGLAHKVVFEPGGKSSVNSLNTNNVTMNSAVKDVYQVFQDCGAVPASPYSFYRLAESKQSILHYPGGAREAYHGKGEEYLLFWPGYENKGDSSVYDFVRLAARFNATIIPLSAIGAADSGFVLGSATSGEFTKAISKYRRIIPQFSNFLQYLLDSPLTARGGREKDPRPPPLVVPKLMPARHYFLFGQPYSTNDLDYKNREECSRAYHLIYSRVEHGIKELRELAKKDPFRDFVKRIFFEWATKKKAPTYSVAEFDNLRN